MASLAQNFDDKKPCKIICTALLGAVHGEGRRIREAQLKERLSFRIGNGPRYFVRYRYAAMIRLSPHTGAQEFCLSRTPRILWHADWQR